MRMKICATEITIHCTRWRGIGCDARCAHTSTSEDAHALTVTGATVPWRLQPPGCFNSHVALPESTDKVSKESLPSALSAINLLVDAIGEPLGRS